VASAFAKVRLVNPGCGSALIAGMSLALAACSSGETSRPGFPRTEITPIEGAPFLYAAPEDVGMSDQQLWLFKERLYSRVVARHLVGSEILVIKDGKIVLHQAMGWADIDRAVPMERGSIFRIASMTKPFVGTATLMLVEQGRIGLEDRIAAHLPSFDNSRSEAITVRQLLTHRSGFAQGAEPPGYAEAPSLLDAVNLLGERGPDYPPGDDFIYSNLNSETLGALIEVVTGERVERFLEQQLIQPLGLSDTHTAFAPDVSWAGRVPSLYRRWGDGPWERFWNPLRPHEVNWFSPAGDLYGTAFDCAEFLTGFLAGQLLPDSTAAAALADPVAGSRPSLPPRWYGMHWEVYAPASDEGGLPAFGHRGATGTVGMAIPDANAIVVYLTNSQETEVVEEVILAALELFGE
jgi:CubicO group peptidase (beta-lactamase class C family)